MTTNDDAPRDRSALRGWVVGLLVVALAVLVGSVGVAVVPNLLHRGSTFCSDVMALPALDTSLDADGTPGPALVSAAEHLEAVAASAPDPATAEAARVLASRDRRLGALVSGSVSGSNVVVDVDVAQLADADARSLDSARADLDRAIADHCG